MEPVEAFLNRLHHPMLASIDLSLDRVHRLLAMLGAPHKRLPPVIHVAGTNGKGSLLAYLQAILEGAGYRVHRYTSPHLVRFRERILLQGKEIDNAYLESIVRHMAPMLSAQPVTFFEATTAAAFLAFADKPADVLLLETGMGGRLDATNVIDKPLLTAITPIALDHVEYLGSSLDKIAGEKAGILKKQVPCVVGKQQAVALKVIEQKAATLGVSLSRYGQEWRVEAGEYQSDKQCIALKPSLAGAYQLDNAATAIACLEQLPQFSVSTQQIERGLANTRWPARLQRLHGAYAKQLPAGIELWLDGGHNAQGGEVLGAWLKERGLPVYLICGMIKGKDMQSYLQHLVGPVQQCIAVTIPGESNAQPAAHIMQAAQALGMQAVAADSVEKALQTIAQHAKTPALICICGSLYLAGKVLAASGE